MVTNRYAQTYIFLLVIMVALVVFTAPALGVQQKNVAIGKVASTTAVLVVKADENADVTVEYGSAPGIYTTTKNSTGQLRHEVGLDGMAPSSTVYYRVTITDSADPLDSIVLPEKSFHTARPPGEPFSFAVAGDNRPATDTTVQPAAWNTIVGQMAGEDIDLSLLAGDIIYGTSSDTLEQNVAKYQGLFDVTTQLTDSVPLYPTPGNHERIYAANSRAGYEQEFTLPVNDGADAGTYGEHYYSFDNGDTHFISLSTEVPGQEGMITGNQKAWLEADLAATSQNWIVVFMHRPLFSGAHGADPWVNLANTAGQQNKADIHNLFTSSGVDVVFEGHDHYYLRHEEDGIQYIITGGGGAPLSAAPPLGPGDAFAATGYEHVLVDETANAMRVTVIDSGGTTLESFTIGVPSLSLSQAEAYWGSYAAFTTRMLSVDYTLTNDGPGDAVNLDITAMGASNSVGIVSAVPMALSDISAGSSQDYTVVYLVPHGVASFRAWATISCNDLGGGSYSFPASG